MKKLILCIIVASFFNTLYAQELEYPKTKRLSHIDTYHGVEVPDPYRWLEDENSNEPKKWVEAQNEVTFKHLDAIGFRPQVRNRLEKLWNFERMSIPQMHKDYLIFSHNTGMQNQNVIFVQEGINGEPFW